MKARTPTSTLNPPLTTAVTVPRMADLSANAFSKADQSMGRSTLKRDKFVIAVEIAAFYRDLRLVAGLQRFSLKCAGEEFLPTCIRCRRTRTRQLQR